MLVQFYNFLTFSALGTFLRESGLGWCNFHATDVITDIGTIGNISLGNFAKMHIIMKTDYSYLLQNNTNKDHNANVYK